MASSSSTRHHNIHKPSALAVRVAAERRQRAIMAMLRDEHSERTDDLDERFRDLNARGMVVTVATAQKMVAARKGAAETKGAENDDDEQKQNGTQKPTPTTTDYDQLYYDLQLLPPPASVVRPTATAAPQIHDGTQIGGGPGDDASSSAPAQSSQNAAGPPLDFGTELDTFLECASAVGAPTSANIAKLDTLLRTRLQPALEKCSVSGPRHILDKLSEFRADFLHSKSARLASSPSFVQVTFLQLVAKLFPSEARFHPILTPTIAFASELVGNTRICSIGQCARLIFLCAQMCDWFCRRPRFFPEVLAFLLGALQLCCESKNEAKEVPFPSMNFPISLPHRQMLFVPPKESTTGTFGNLSLAQIFHPNIGDLEAENGGILDVEENGGDAGAANTDEDKCRLRLATVRALFATIGQYARKYGTTAADESVAAAGDQPTNDDGTMRPAFNACFGPFHRFCLRLPVANYPAQLADEAAQLTQLLAKLMAQNGRVTQMKRITKRGTTTTNSAIKMLEPRFDERFDPERRNNKSNDSNGMKAREKSWAKRAKNERRGALKELRKGARGMANAYADRQRKVRRERDEKTKRIMQCLEVQESEHKKLKALKK
ncbi:hypothetical protein niasHT_017549 [Heterodera trifolii]|uniref:Uncharacterized protein n=1 Tax=Heterodera trifolii TaxID=157864 RepID=A0ABD2L663_9BILA